MKDSVQSLVLRVTKVFVTCVRLQTQPKNFQKLKLVTKNRIFLVKGKTPVIQFSYMEKTCHRDFIQFSVRMELYENVWQELSHI